jgi:hypothetical protein
VASFAKNYCAPSDGNWAQVATVLFEMVTAKYAARRKSACRCGVADGLQILKLGKLLAEL